MISTLTVLFDANVFFGTALRSLVVELSATGLFRARWTSDIHAEWVRAVAGKRPDIDRDRLLHVASLMDRAVPDCLVTGYEGLMQSLSLPDPDDRHVLAAAIVGHAECIVTFNEKDFPTDVLSPYRIHTRHPDAFLTDLDELEEGVLVDAARADLGHYKNPPLTTAVYIERLRNAGVPQAADYLSRMRVLIEP